MINYVCVARDSVSSLCMTERHSLWKMYIPVGVHLSFVSCSLTHVSMHISTCLKAASEKKGGTKQRQ